MMNTISIIIFCVSLVVVLGFGIATMIVQHRANKKGEEVLETLEKLIKESNDIIRGGK